ncbi:hypothetical protein BZG73_02640 [Salinivibrio siamensis]|uniref:Uncharacterized protein n=1 Tax=Salinivibrio siamensis TaxID=414286 RepID=A0ABX3KDP5_9GAMM|nr:hypothetical protein [Salinivibrio siamensis]OOE87115.1 hypothetical protein BZG73_02640 [Salinivibrio siamensis]
MIKAKWLYSELPLNLIELSRLMKEQQYSEEAGLGFLLSVSTSSKLSGKYVERQVQRSVVENPFGEVTEVESVNYYTCQFNWISDSKYMYITNPPRSLRKFLNKLHDIIGLGLVLSEVNVAPEQWVSYLEHSTDSLKVTRLSSYGIRVSHGATAKVTVNGVKDIRRDFTTIIADKRYLIDSAKFKAEFGSLELLCEFTRLGVCRLKTANVSFVLDKVREALERALISQE